MTDKEALIQIQDLKNSKGDLISIRIRRHNLQLRNPELYDFLISRYADCTSLSEAIYRLENGLENAPKCPICGNTLKFVRYCTGYQIFCSNKCKYSEEGHKEMIDKTKQTMKERYGFDWFTQTDAYNDKCKETSLQKYGTEHFTQSDMVKQHSIETCLQKYGVEHSCQSENNKQKSRQTMIDRYGEDHPMRVNEIKEKYKMTCQERFNKDFYVQTEDFQQKSLVSRRKTEKEKWLNEGFDLDFIGNGLVTIHNYCEIHGDITMKISTFFNRYKNPESLCTICNPLEKGPASFQEIQIAKFLKENKIKFKMHDRKILGNGKELDFYLEDYQIGIECNGVYWHSDIAGCDKGYHQEKSQICEDKGILLIHIWEDQMINDKEGVFRFLKQVINREKPEDFVIEKKDKCICLSKRKEVIAQMELSENENCYVIKNFEIYDFCLMECKKILIQWLIENVDFAKVQIEIDFNVENGLFLEALGFKLKEIRNPKCWFICDRQIKRIENCVSDNFWCCYDAGSKIYEMKKEP